MLQWFQSSGKPWTATTSTSSTTPCDVISRTKLGSIGEMPPSTMVKSGLTRRIACAAFVVISANIFQSGSILKSQWERLLGSFHSITASTMSFRSLSCLGKKKLQGTVQLHVQDISAVADGISGNTQPGLRFGMGHNCEARSS